MIPEGGKLFLYTSDKKQSIGAFTSKNSKGDSNNPRGFATELLFSDKITIEYYQPKEVKDEAIISISNVVHGYKQINLNRKSLRTSDFCQVDINCQEGQNWQNEKKAIALIVMGNSHGTGSLVTTTSNGLNPYFFTANHLLSDVYNSDGNHDALLSPDLDNWVFYWNYDAQGCNDANITSYTTTSGATILANNNISDFALLRLEEDPQNITGYHPYYLGWDASGNTEGCGVCIHHPHGDTKRIYSKET